ESEQPVLRRQIRRQSVARFFATLAPTRIGMEACGASHHWARLLRSLGHEGMLIPPQYVKAYGQRGKNDKIASRIGAAAQWPDRRWPDPEGCEQLGDSLVECGHMSGLCVRSVDRWPRWGTRIGSQTPYVMSTHHWAPRVVPIRDQ